MFGFRKTRTLAALEVSAQVYDEVADLLRAAGYDHAFIDGAIDMQGIGLTRAPEPHPVVRANMPISRNTGERKRNTAPGAI